MCASHWTRRQDVARVSATLNLRLPQTLQRQSRPSTEANWTGERSELIFQCPELRVLKVAGVAEVVVGTEVVVSVADVAVGLAIEVASAVVVAVIEVASAVVVAVIEVAGVASVVIVVAKKCLLAGATVIMPPMRMQLLTLEVLCRSKEKRQPSEEGLRPTIAWLDALI